MDNIDRLQRIYPEADNQRIYRRSSWRELRAFLQKHDIRGKVCLEIGTLNALTAILLAERFERVISVDIKQGKCRQQVIEALPIDNITFMTIAGNEEKRRIVEALEFDFAYVDGNRLDAVHDFELVRHCGRVLLHDHWDETEPVWGLMDSLPPEQVVRESPMAYWHAG